METVRIYASRWRNVVLALVSLAFVAAGVSLSVGDVDWQFRRGGSVPGPVQVAVGVVSIGFFGLAALYFVVEAVRPRAILVIDVEGVIGRATLYSAGRLYWRDIGTVQTVTTGREPTLLIHPRDPNELFARSRGVHRFVLRLNKRFGFPPVPVAQSDLPIPIPAFVDLIRQHNPAVRAA